MSSMTEPRHKGCTHEFSYLLKRYGDGGFTARVMEIPAVIVSGRSQDDLESEVKEATLGYLRAFEKEHEKAVRHSLKPILVSPKLGIVVGVKPFKVTC